MLRSSNVIVEEVGGRRLRNAHFRDSLSTNRVIFYQRSNGFIEL